MTITVILVVLAFLWWIGFTWLDRSMLGSIAMTAVVTLVGTFHLLDVLAGDLFSVLWLVIAAAALGLRLNAYRDGSLPTRQ